MRFLVSYMPLSPRLAAWLKENGHDADHASGVGLHKAKDHHLIESARQQNRIIMTAQQRDITPGAAQRIAVLEAQEESLREELREQRLEILGAVRELDRKLEAHMTQMGR